MPINFDRVNTYVGRDEVLQAAIEALESRVEKIEELLKGKFDTEDRPGTEETEQGKSKDA